MMIRWLFVAGLSLAQASPEYNASAPNDVSICTKPDGSKAPCVPGNQQCSQYGFGRNTPQFHVRDNSCGENDPNGPIYDPVHGVYHLHYQNHVGLHGGRTYGHAVSRDFAHWAHMPISIWNDRDYDARAIYTGSGTVVDGKVVQVYPGLCDTKQKGCPGGTNLCIAVPADPADPLQTNWTKEEFTSNPIVPATGRDPSTAWKTASGEWRLTTFDTQIYGSMDFKTWYKIGPQPGFPHGECPSFFPMPRNTPGAGPAPDGAKTYTHVHKASHGGDWMQVGTYVENGPKQNGGWTAETEVKIDMGRFYASKDFYDPAKKRRINFGWAQVPPASTQTLAREVTWNPELQQLVHSPVEEMEKLRGGVIGTLKSQALTAGESVAVGLPKQVGNQSEIIVSFQRPSAAARLSVQVMAGSKSPSPPGPPYAKEMPGIDLPGGDYDVTHENYTDFKLCEAACNKDAKCQAWTYVVRPPLHADCCLKKTIPASRKKSSCTSGVKTPPAPPAPSPSGKTGIEFFVQYVPPSGNGVSEVKVGSGSTVDTLKLSPNDKTIDMRLFVDNTFTEAYWMGGRVAMTIDTAATEEADVLVGSDKTVTLASATVWKVNSIWVSPEEVKNTPRMDAVEVVV